MLKIKVCVALLVSVLTLGAVAAHASVTEVEYTFFAQLGGNNTESAQFLVPSFITSDVTIPFSQIKFCQIETNPCGSIDLQPNLYVTGLGLFDVFRENNQTLRGVGFAFPVGSFDAVGTYFDLSGTALLSVQTVTFTPTPEPSALLLMSSGALGVAGMLRRRLLR